MLLASVVVKSKGEVTFRLTFYSEIYVARWNGLVEFMASGDFTSLVLACIETVVKVKFPTVGPTSPLLSLHRLQLKRPLMCPRIVVLL